MINKFLSNKINLINLNYYYSRILQKVAYRTRAGFGRPTSPTLLLTNRCNASCLHCHSWKLPKTNNEMDTEQWLHVLDELRKWLGPVFISITGGETLLRKDAVEITRHAARLGFWVEFLTNGYLMDDKTAQSLIQSGVKRITISLDGSKEEIHDRIRGKKGFYKKATKDLELLSKYMQQSKRHVELYAKTAVMSINIDDLSNILRLATSLKVYGVEFQAIEPVYYSKQLREPDWYKNNPLWIRDTTRTSSAIEKLKTLKGKGYPVINSVENLNMIEDYFNEPERLSDRVHSHTYKKLKKGCNAFVGGLQIMPDGGMKMCHMMEPFANAKNGRLRQAWLNRSQCWKHPCEYVA